MFLPTRPATCWIKKQGDVGCCSMLQALQGPWIKVVALHLSNWRRKHSVHWSLRSSFRYQSPLRAQNWSSRRAAQNWSSRTRLLVMRRRVHAALLVFFRLLSLRATVGSESNAHSMLRKANSVLFQRNGPATGTHKSGSDHHWFLIKWCRLALLGYDLSMLSHHVFLLYQLFL